MQGLGTRRSLKSSTSFECSSHVDAPCIVVENRTELEPHTTNTVSYSHDGERLNSEVGLDEELGTTASLERNKRRGSKKQWILASTRRMERVKFKRQMEKW